MSVYHLPFASRKATIPMGKWLGVGIGPSCEHGLLLANGEPIGPGSPLLLDGGEREIELELVRPITTPEGGTALQQYRAHAVAVTCHAELAALCRPRPARMRHLTGTIAAGASVDIDVPFTGRKEFSGHLYYLGSGGTPGITLTTYAVITDAAGSHSGQLNQYTAANMPNDAATPFYETERCDFLSLNLAVTGFPLSYILRLAAFDEGT